MTSLLCGLHFDAYPNPPCLIRGLLGVPGVSDVLVEPEDVVGIPLALERHEPLVLRVSLGVDFFA
jgi:hypothetical protein